MLLFRCMIKNIIFDMGNVLIDFKPDLFLEKMGLSNPKDRKIILDNCVEKDYWLQYDLGKINIDTLIQKSLENVPNHLKKYTKELIRNWYKYAEVVKGMPELVQELKDKGYKLYLLSNAGYNQPSYFKKFPYKLDGQVVSAFYHVAKPDAKIYEILLNKYHLKANECLFIDDRPANVLGAADQRIAVGLTFTNIKELRKDLKKYL